MTAVKTFNFLNAFILQVACSAASKHHQLSVQTCCCSLLPRHEESMEIQHSASLCFLNAAPFFSRELWETFASQELTGELARDDETQN